ncbi:hypothetical protein ACNKHQ_20980 [Shigella flexneri]
MATTAAPSVGLGFYPLYAAGLAPSSIPRLWRSVRWGSHSGCWSGHRA